MRARDASCFVAPESFVVVGLLQLSEVPPANIGVEWESVAEEWEEGEKETRVPIRRGTKLA